MRLLTFVSIHLILLLEKTSTISAASDIVLFGVRGGSSSWSRAATPVRPASKRTSGSKVRYPVVQDLDEDYDASNMDFSKSESKEAAKEMMDAFLTRDSRNSFVGEQ